MRIAIVGAFGIGSTGDEAGLTVLKDALKDYAELIVFMRNPTAEYAEHYNCKLWSKLEHHTREAARGRIFCGMNVGDNPVNIENIISIFKTCDLVMLGPGDFINEDCKGFLRGALPEMVVMAWLAEMAGTPFMIYAASARLLKEQYSKYQLQWLLNKAATITFRGRISVDLLEESGIKGVNKIKVLPDPVECFMINDRQTPVPGKLFLSVRSLAYKGKNTEIKYRHLIRNVIDKYEGEILSIPMFISDDGYPDDITEMYEINNNIKTINEHNKMWPEETMYYISSCSRGLTTRLHAAVMCYTLGIPFVSIAYEPKVIGFCESVGAKYFNIDSDPDTVFNALMAAEPIPVRHSSMNGYITAIKGVIDEYC